MNNGQFSGFQGSSHTLTSTRPSIDFSVSWKYPRNRKQSHTLVNCVHYGVICCFVGQSARKRQLFHPLHLPCLTEPKYVEFPLKNEQRHPAKAECRLFVCCPILFDRCRFRNSFKLLSYQHPGNALPVFGMDLKIP